MSHYAQVQQNTLIRNPLPDAFNTKDVKLENSQLFVF